MELRIEPASDELYLQLREWRYPPPYDFYDGDVDPPENPERFFAALDPSGELVGFYYFEEKPPDLDYAHERYRPRRVYLHVAEFNDRARKVYERAGFVEVSRHVRSFERFGDVVFVTMGE